MPVAGGPGDKEAGGDEGEGEHGDKVEPGGKGAGGVQKVGSAGGDGSANGHGEDTGRRAYPEGGRQEGTPDSEERRAVRAVEAFVQGRRAGKASLLCPQTYAIDGKVATSRRGCTAGLDDCNAQWWPASE